MSYEPKKAGGVGNRAAYTTESNVRAAAGEARHEELLKAIVWIRPWQRPEPEARR